MKSLNQNTFLLSEQEVPVQIQEADPILKVNLYGKNLQDGSWKTIYLKVIQTPQLHMLEIENSIRSILRKYSKKTLAFNYELLNPHGRRRNYQSKVYTTAGVL